MDPSRHDQVASLAFATVGSRVLGLVRDVLIFSLLGLSSWTTAFLFAFTLPNLFRRLLGEGALSSAMIPLFSQLLAQRDEAAAFEFLNRLICRLAAVFALLLVVLAVALLSICRLVDPAHRSILYLSLFLLPYLPLICLSAMLCGALNVLGRFWQPALTAAWLNLIMIIFGGVGWLCFGGDPRRCAHLLSVGVLVGGLVQLLIPWWLLRRLRWRFRQTLSSDLWLRRLRRLLLPAFLGASITQINASLSRIIATFFTAHGMATLYLSNRLIELPLGIFVVSISSVAFPRLSQLRNGHRMAEFADCYRSTQRSMMMVTLPAMVGLLLLGRPILSLLFQWGRFGRGDLGETLPVLWATALGLPFYGLTATAIRAFHSLQDMRRPLVIAAWTVLFNLALLPLLVQPLAAVGIGLAGSLSTAFQYGLLRFQLGRQHGLAEPIVSGRQTLSLAAANLGLGLLLVCLSALPSPMLGSKLLLCLNLLLVLALAAVSYCFLLDRLRFPEVSLFKSLLGPLPFLGKFIRGRNRHG